MIILSNCKKPRGLGSNIPVGILGFRCYQLLNNKNLLFWTSQRKMKKKKAVNFEQFCKHHENLVAAEASVLIGELKIKLKGSFSWNYLTEFVNLKIMSE